MECNIIGVYVKTNNSGIITEINSELFIDNIDEWIKIDEGTGDKFAHAQGSYLENGLVDCENNYNYKLLDGKVIALTSSEKKTLCSISVINQPTIPDLQTQIFDLMSQLIMGGLL